MKEKKFSPRHTALIIPDGRTRIYDRDPELAKTNKHDAIEIPAKDVFLGRMSSLSRQYAEKFYPDDWFILSTNNNKGQNNKDQPWLVHPDTPIKGDYDNPPYPIPPEFMENGELQYWQPFLENRSLNQKLTEEAEKLNLLPQNGKDDKEYSRIIFLGNWKGDTWGSWESQKNWDNWVHDNPSCKFKSRNEPDLKDYSDSPIYSVFNSHRYEYSLYVEVINALFEQHNIWREFPLLDCATEGEMISRISDAIYRKFPLHRSPYSLKKICVKNLFRMKNPDFNYPNLPLGIPANIQIITAPNGYGKSTIFRLIRAIFKGNLKEISDIPFKYVEITLDDGNGESTILVDKSHLETSQTETVFSITFSQKNGETRKFPPSDETFKPDYKDQKWMEKTARQLGKVIPPVSLLFLSSERLFHDPLQKIYPYDLLSEENDERFKKNLSRAQYNAKSLARRINGVLADYAIISHKLDVRFPVDLLKKISSDIGEKYGSGFPEPETRFSTLKDKRKQLEVIDFLPFKKWYDHEIDPFATGLLHEKSAMNFQDFMGLYLKRQEEKYKVFNWLNDRCQMFENIIKDLLIFTRIRIKRDKGFSFYNLYEGAGQYHEINLDQISSGEMHQVVMYYEFLFNSDPGTVVLIDEPEISLHVYAQSLFIDNILSIAKKNNLQFIVATHSPTIIGDHGNVTYDLLTGAYND